MTTKNQKRDKSPLRARRRVHPHVGPRTLTLFARVVRSWRVELGATWSRIGELATLVFHRDHIAAMLNHTSDKTHTLGHRLCNFAMDRLGQRVEDGWNESVDSPAVRTVMMPGEWLRLKTWFVDYLCHDVDWKPSQTAFTAGEARDAASAFEAALRECGIKRPNRKHEVRDE